MKPNIIPFIHHGRPLQAQGTFSNLQLPDITIVHIAIFKQLHHIEANT